MLICRVPSRERLGKVIDVRESEVQSLCPSRWDDVRGIARKEEVPPTHRLGDVAPQWSYRLLDGRARHQCRRCLGRDPRTQLIPELIVGPRRGIGVGSALHVVARQHRVAHRAESETPRVAGIDELVADRRRLRQNAHPTKRIQPFVLACLVSGNGVPADAVKPIASGDVVALDRAALTMKRVAQRRRSIDQIMQLHVLGFEDDRPASADSRVVQVLLDLGLAVDHHHAVDQRFEVDAEGRPGIGDRHAFVHEALTIHACTETQRSKQVTGALLDHTCPDPGLDVFARSLLDDDVVDVGSPQQM